MVTFEELGVNAKVRGAIEDMGWTEPTPVQVESIPEGLNGRDIFAQAQTGTGKTGTYAMILLGRISSGNREPKALVLCPTRELASQVDEEIYKMTKYTKHRSMAIYGGTRYDNQIRCLDRGVDIVVGTPGRIKDLIEKEVLNVNEISELVIDEADRMFDMGFEEELNFILNAVPAEKQMLLFSATMEDSIMDIATRHMVAPLQLLVSKDEPCSDLVSQYFIPVSRGGKREKLDFILSNGNPKTIVFCQTKKMVDELTTDLSQKYKVGSIHGDMQQMKREKTIKNYRNDRFQVLIATDVAARGLDVNNIDVVVNYDVPSDPETYLHRIGRTGRAGKEGVAISFVTKMEDYRIRMYESETGKRIVKVKVEDLAPIESKPVEVFRPEPKPEFRREANREVAEKPRFEKPHYERPTKVREAPVSNSNMVALQINLGREDGFGRPQIIDFVKKITKIDAKNIGRVGLGNATSYIEIEASCVDEAIEKSIVSRSGGKTVFMQIAPKKVPYSEKVGKVARQVGAFADKSTSTIVPDSL